MHPILSNVRLLLWYMGAWLMAGVFIALLLAIAGFARWANAFYFALPVALVYGFLASSAYYICRSRPFATRQSLLAIVVFGGASVISGYAWLLMCRAWNNVGPVFGLDGNLITLSQNRMVLLFALGCGLYVMSILAHDVLIAFDNVREAERRQARSELLARDAELQLLRTQINPHFLFNSLNSISALTTIDPAAARQMTIELAQFFRITVALSEKQVIALDEEIALCESFLAIEKIRFGKKLQAAFVIDDAARHCMIPPMLLQPLVENAIKHGIRDLSDGGTISINATVRGDELHVSVENPIDPAPTAIPGQGVGLHNIRQRLTNIYAEKAQIRWTRTEAQFAVGMVLPFVMNPINQTDQSHESKNESHHR